MRATAAIGSRIHKRITEHGWKTESSPQLSNPELAKMYKRNLIMIKNTLRPGSTTGDGAHVATTNPYDYGYKVWLPAMLPSRQLPWTQPGLPRKGRNTGAGLPPGSLPPAKPPVPSIPVLTSGATSVRNSSSLNTIRSAGSCTACTGTVWRQAAHSCATNSGRS